MENSILSIPIQDGDINRTVALTASVVSELNKLAAYHDYRSRIIDLQSVWKSHSMPQPSDGDKTDLAWVELSHSSDVALETCNETMGYICEQLLCLFWLCRVYHVEVRKMVNVWKREITFNSGPFDDWLAGKGLLLTDQNALDDLCGI